MPQLTDIRDIWRSLESRGQLTLAASLAIVAVAGYVLYHYATKPSYTAVQTGITPAETNRVTQALGAAGIPFRVTAAGTEVDVPSSSQSAAAVALSAHGLGGGAQPGLEQVTKSSLGMTDLQQKVLYQEGLQGELEQQIEGIAGINSAQVTLVLPTDALFADQASAASAAVLLNAATTLTGSQVSGIAHMVASGVQGLDPQNVTVTDGMGELLWPATGADGSLTAGSKLAAQQSYDAQLAAQLNAVLVQTLGPGKATASVNADLNVDQVTTDSVTYTGPRTALQSQSSNEKLSGAGAGAAGPAGTASNVPPVYSGTGAGGGAGSTYTNSSNSSTYGQDKTVTHTLVAPGSVKSLSVSVLFDSKIPAPQQAAIKQTVMAMVGFTPSRGDKVTVAAVPFPKADELKAGSSAGLMGTGLSMIQIGEYAGIAVACLVFLFLVRRSLRAREGEALFAEPRWLNEIQRMTPLAELEAPPPPLVPSPEHAHQEQVMRQMQDIVERNPDQVAMQVSQWMNEG